MDRSMDGVIHRRGEDSMSRAQQIQHLRARYVFLKVLFFRWEYMLFLFLLLRLARANQTPPLSPQTGSTNYRYDSGPCYNLGG